MDLAQKVYEHVNALPEPAVQEVLNFVEFLTSRLAQTKKYVDASQTADNRWPDIILSFEGVPDMPPFEQDRAHLLPPSEDPLIAATALVHGLTLVTSNTGEFRRVSGLNVEDWRE